MALNALGASPQIPLSNTFQPGQNSGDVKTDDSNKKSGDVTQAKAPTQSAPAENKNAAPVAQRENVKPLPNNDNDADDKKRGKLLDITV